MLILYYAYSPPTVMPPTGLLHCGFVIRCCIGPCDNQTSLTLNCLYCTRGTLFCTYNCEAACMSHTVQFWGPH
jgi:hypothetical protein